MKLWGSVYRKADFIIERSGAQITMRDRTGGQTPIRAGDVLAGSETLDHILGRLGEELHRAGEVSAAGVVALTNRIEARLASSPAAQDLLRAMQQSAEKLPLSGKPEFTQFVERWVPQLRTLEQRYMRELEENGLATAAQTFWQDFASWLTELVPHPRDSSSLGILGQSDRSGDCTCEFRATRTRTGCFLRLDAVPGSTSRRLRS